MIVLLWAACTAGSGHQLPVASSPPDTAAQDTADTAEQDTADTAEPQHTCDDGPWREVRLGFYSACGLHEDGCVECWGSTRWGVGTAIYATPAVSGVSIAMYQDPNNDFEAGASPAACAVEDNGVVTCWGAWDMDLFTPEHPDKLAKQVVFGDYGQFAILDQAGVLWAKGLSGEYSPVEGVSGTLSWGVGVTAVRDGHVRTWSAEPTSLVEWDMGPVDDWSYYGICIWAFCGVRSDGAVGYRRSREDDFTVVQPPGSPWIAVYGDWLLEAPDHLVYAGYPEVASEPIFPEPAAQVDAKWEAACAVTFDGRLECSGLMHDTYPPPGSYVVPD